MRTRILLFLLTLILVPLMTYGVILFAKGYRPNITNGQISSTGLLAATSLPEGAEIVVNGELRSATDNTVNLAPGTYEVEIKKEGYSPWKKTLEVKQEVVTRANAILFPTVPSLRAITSVGASRPSISPNANQVAFIRDEGNLSNIYVLDLSESPLGSINRDAKLLASLPKLEYVLSWSPDSKQILSIASPSAYLITTADQRTAPAAARLPAIKAEWALLQKTIDTPRLATLPLVLRDIVASSAANILWSPQEDKILYTATASASIPTGLARPLPGSNTQAEVRDITANNMYVYDIKEDKNFLVGNTSTPLLSWFPTSNHLVKIEKNKVTIMEYDGSNPAVVYAGPMEDGYAFPYPSSKQLLILTNLNPATITPSNLYAVSLR